MPYIEGEPVLLHEHKPGCRISTIPWISKGQCVACKPAEQFLVELPGGVEIKVQARSQHKGRSIAVDIVELFS